MFKDVPHLIPNIFHLPEKLIYISRSQARSTQVRAAISNHCKVKKTPFPSAHLTQARLKTQKQAWKIAMNKLSAISETTCL